ncbi:glycosyltransferase family 4 protein, partial [Kitasatospora sp. NPDC001225]
LVAHHRTGLLVPPRDAAAVARAVAELAADPARRAGYGQAGRAEVTARTWEAVGDLLLRHYAEVLAEHRGVRLPSAAPASAAPVAPALSEELPA